MASKCKNVSIETKIQKWILKDKLAYIELLIYQRICSVPLDFDIYPSFTVSSVFWLFFQDNLILINHPHRPSLAKSEYADRWL